MADEINAYQKENNSQWFTEDKLKCDVCNRLTNQALEVKTPDGTYLGCWLFKKDKKQSCGMILIQRYLRKYETIKTRLLINESFEVKRKSVGLSLRYDVLSRDKFKCVICGRTAKDTTLEIDHIIPVVSGGKTIEENLQTLCFDCNRGKKDK